MSHATSGWIDNWQEFTGDDRRRLRAIVDVQETDGQDVGLDGLFGGADEPADTYEVPAPMSVHIEQAPEYPTEPCTDPTPTMVLRLPSASLPEITQTVSSESEAAASDYGLIVPEQRPMRAMPIRPIEIPESQLTKEQREVRWIRIYLDTLQSNPEDGKGHMFDQRPLYKAGAIMQEAANDPELQARLSAAGLPEDPTNSEGVNQIFEYIRAGEAYHADAVAAQEQWQDNAKRLSAIRDSNPVMENYLEIYNPTLLNELNDAAVDPAMRLALSRKVIGSMDYRRFWATSREAQKAVAREDALLTADVNEAPQATEPESQVDTGVWSTGWTGLDLNDTLSDIPRVSEAIEPSAPADTTPPSRPVPVDRGERNIVRPFIDPFHLFPPADEINDGLKRPPVVEFKMIPRAPARAETVAPAASSDMEIEAVAPELAPVASEPLRVVSYEINLPDEYYDPTAAGTAQPDSMIDPAQITLPKKDSSIVIVNAALKPGVSRAYVSEASAPVAMDSNKLKALRKTVVRDIMPEINRRPRGDDDEVRVIAQAHPIIEAALKLFEAAPDKEGFRPSNDLERRIRNTYFKKRENYLELLRRYLSYESPAAVTELGGN